MAIDVPPEPWHAFLLDVDQGLEQQVTLHCLGAFVIAMLYGLPRKTIDIDCLGVIPVQEIRNLESRAGRESPLHRKHGVYLQHTGIVTLAENYLDRLIPIYPGVYCRLQLLGLDPYDLALSKMERNSPRDRDDVKFLMRAVPLDFSTLENRYRVELRPYLANEERHDLTLELWRDMVEPTDA